MSIILEIIGNKSLKGKQQTTAITEWLSSDAGNVDELISAAAIQKDVPKANCIEAFENCTKINSELCNETAILFVISELESKTPRVKWESARVIGNCIAKHPKHAEKAMNALLKNAQNEGTVVKWSAAYALGEIIKLKLPLNKNLIPVAEEIILNEEKNSIKKIYQAAIKKANKS